MSSYDFDYDNLKKRRQKDKAAHEEERTKWDMQMASHLEEKSKNQHTINGLEEQLENQIANEAKEKKEMSQKITELKSEVETVKASMKEKIRSGEQERITLEEKISQLRNRISQKAKDKQDKTALEEKLTNLEKKVDELNSTIRRLEEEKIKLKSEVSNCQKVMKEEAEASETEIQELKDKVAALGLQIVELEKKNKELSSCQSHPGLQSKESEIATLQVKLEETNAELDNLKEQHNLSKQKCEGLESEVEVLKRQKETGINDNPNATAKENEDFRKLFKDLAELTGKPLPGDSQSYLEIRNEIVDEILRARGAIEVNEKMSGPQKMNDVPLRGPIVTDNTGVLIRDIDFNTLTANPSKKQKKSY